MADRPYTRSPQERLDAQVLGMGATPEQLTRARSLARKLDKGILDANAGLPSPYEQQSAAPAVAPAPIASSPSPPVPSVSFNPSPEVADSAPAESGQTPTQAILTEVGREASQLSKFGGVRLPFYKAISRKIHEKGDIEKSQTALRQVINKAKLSLGETGFRELTAGAETGKELSQRLQDWAMKDAGYDRFRPIEGPKYGRPISLDTTPAGPAIRTEDMRSSFRQKKRAELMRNRPEMSQEEVEQSAMDYADQEVARQLSLVTDTPVVTVDPDKLVESLSRLGPAGYIGAFLLPSTSEVVTSGRLSQMDHGTKGMLQWVLDAAPSTLLAASLATATEGKELEALHRAIPTAREVLFPTTGAVTYGNRVLETMGDPEVMKATLAGESLVTQYETLGKAFFQSMGIPDEAAAPWVGFAGGTAAALIFMTEPDVFMAAGPVGKALKLRKMKGIVKMAEADRTIIKGFLDNPDVLRAAIKDGTVFDALSGMSKEKLSATVGLEEIDKLPPLMVIKKAKAKVKEAEESLQRIAEEVSTTIGDATPKIDPEQAEAVRRLAAARAFSDEALFSATAAKLDAHLEFLGRKIPGKSTGTIAESRMKNDLEIEEAKKGLEEAQARVDDAGQNVAPLKGKYDTLLSEVAEADKVKRAAEKERKLAKLAHSRAVAKLAEAQKRHKDGLVEARTMYKRAKTYKTNKTRLKKLDDAKKFEDKVQSRWDDERPELRKAVKKASKEWKAAFAKKKEAVISWREAEAARKVEKPALNLARKAEALANSEHRKLFRAQATRIKRRVKLGEDMALRYNYEHVRKLAAASELSTKMLKRADALAAKEASKLGKVLAKIEKLEAKRVIQEAKAKTLDDLQERLVKDMTSLSDSLGKLDAGTFFRAGNLEVNGTQDGVQLKRTRMIRDALDKSVVYGEDKFAPMIDVAGLRQSIVESFGKDVFDAWMTVDATGTPKVLQKILRSGLAVVPVPKVGLGSGASAADIASEGLSLVKDGLSALDSMMETSWLYNAGLLDAADWLRMARDTRSFAKNASLGERLFGPKWARFFDADWQAAGKVEVSDEMLTIAKINSNLLKTGSTDLTEIRHRYGNDPELYRRKMWEYLGTTKGVDTRRQPTQLNTLHTNSLWRDFQEMVGDWSRRVEDDVVRKKEAARESVIKKKPVKEPEVAYVTYGDNPAIMGLLNAWVGITPLRVGSKQAMAPILGPIIDAVKGANAPEDAFDAIEEIISRKEFVSQRTGRILGSFYSIVMHGAVAQRTLRRMASTMGPITDEQARTVNRLLEGRGAETKELLDDGIKTLNRLGMSTAGRNFFDASDRKTLNKIVEASRATDGSQFFVPQSLLTMMDKESQAHLREREFWVTAEAKGKIPAAMSKYAHWLKTSVVGGLLIPDISYQIGNVLFSDMFQIFGLEGVGRTFRVSANTLPAVVPAFSKVFGAPGRSVSGAMARRAMALQAKYGEVPYLGSVLNSAMNPKISAIMSSTDGSWRIGNDLYTTKRLQRELIEDGIMDTEVKEDVLSVTEKAFDQAKGNSISLKIQKWQHDLTMHAQNVSVRQRIGLYVDLRERGATREEARKRTLDALFDWSHGVSQREMDLTVFSTVFFYRYAKLSTRQAWNTLMEPLVRGGGKDYYIKAATGRSRIARLRQTYYAQRSLAEWDITKRDPNEEEDLQREYAAVGAALGIPGWVDQESHFGYAYKASEAQRIDFRDREAGRSVTYLYDTLPEPSTLGAFSAMMNFLGMFAALGVAASSDNHILRARALEVPLMEISDVLHPSLNEFIGPMLFDTAGGGRARTPVTAGMATVIDNVGRLANLMGADFGHVTMDEGTNRLMADAGVVALIRALPLGLQVPRLLDDANNPHWKTSWFAGMTRMLGSAAGYRTYATDPTSNLERIQRRVTSGLTAEERAAESRAQPRGNHPFIRKK